MGDEQRKRQSGSASPDALAARTPVVATDGVRIELDRLATQPASAGRCRLRGVARGADALDAGRPTREDRHRRPEGECLWPG